MPLPRCRRFTRKERLLIAGLPLFSGSLTALVGVLLRDRNPEAIAEGVFLTLVFTLATYLLVGGIIYRRNLAFFRPEEEVNAIDEEQQRSNAYGSVDADPDSSINL